MTEHELFIARIRHESAYFHAIFRRQTMLADKKKRQIKLLRKKFDRKEEIA